MTADDIVRAAHRYQWRYLDLQAATEKAADSYELERAGFKTPEIGAWKAAQAAMEKAQSELFTLLDADAATSTEQRESPE